MQQKNIISGDDDTRCGLVGLVDASKNMMV